MTTPRFCTREEFERKVYDQLAEGPNYAYHPAVGWYVSLVKKPAKPKTDEPPSQLEGEDGGS